MKPILSKENKECKVPWYSDNPSTWHSITEIKKKKEQQLDNNLLNEIETDTAAEPTTDKQINLDSINNNEPIDTKQPQQTKKTVVKNWKNEDDDDDNEPTPVVDPNQKKNIDVAVLSSPGNNK